MADLKIIIKNHNQLAGLNLDDHPQYFDQTRGDLRYSQLGHNHDDRYFTEGELSTILGGYSPTSHVHALSVLTQSGATTGQVPVWNGSAWVPGDQSGGGGTPGGSNSQLQFNDGGVFGGDSQLIWDKGAKSLNVQTTLKQHPFHVSSSAGATIPDVATASVVQSDEVLNSSPTGTITLIPEFPAPSGSMAGQNTSGSGYSASNQTIDYRIYAAILDGTTYYRSQYFGTATFTDTLNDGSSFSILLSLPTPVADQTHWIIEKDVNFSGFNDSTIVSLINPFEDGNFSGSSSYAGWPSQYTFSYTAPTPPSADSAQEVDIGFGNLTENGTTYLWEIRSAADIGGLFYCEQIGLTGNSFLDANMANSFNLQIDWSTGGGNDQVIRISIDSGATWSYHYVGSMTGQFIYSGQGSDSSAEAAWVNDVASAYKRFSFACYARTSSPSSSGYVYTETADQYHIDINTPNVGYIFKHSFAGFTPDGGKIVADFETGITGGKVIATEPFLDAGFNLWGDGVTLTPNHIGFLGTEQNREYKFYGYSGSLLIYSSIALVRSTSDGGGYKYNTLSFSYPPGVTTVKITRSINGGPHNSAIILTSPTATVIDDALISGGWSSSTTTTPTSSVPTASRFDLSRTTINQTTDNVMACDTTGSGVRFPSFAFAIAPDVNSPHSSVVGRLVVNSASGRLLIGATGVEGYGTREFGAQVFSLGHDYSFNLGKSNTKHFTMWAGDVSFPLFFAYSAGDSNRGTFYIGQNSTSFGTSSKVVIAPTSGGTTGLHFRRTSGFSGDNILIDEAGSFKAGWGAAGRMFLNATAISATTYLLIGGISSGSQIRLAGSNGNGVVEGDIWNDSTQKSLTAFIAGLKQFDCRNLFNQTVSGTCANTTAETTISNTGVGTLTLPANFLSIGKTLRIKISGFFSSVSAPTLRLKIKAGSTVLLDTTAVALGNHTNAGFSINAEVTCRTIGAGGTVFSQGVFYEIGGTKNSHKMVNTSATSLSTTVSQALSVSAQWGTANAGNTITLSNLMVQILS